MVQVRKDKVQIELEINGQRQTLNTIAGFQKAYKQLNSELRQLVVGSDEYNKKLQDLQRVKGALDDQRARFRGIRKEIEQLPKGGAKYIEFLKKAGIFAAGAFAVDKLKDFAVQLFQNASALELYDKKSKQVFGDSIKTVERFAAVNANAMGLTRREYINAATAAADLLIPIGFQRDEASKLSTDIVNLSGALSEWSAGQFSSTEVTTKLNKALLGEREELKQLGIAINEADVKQRLATKGQEELTGNALKQAKALATLELIYEKSTDAQDAFRNNSNSLARTQAQLQATFSQITETLATKLLPSFSKGLSFIADLIGANTKYSDTLEEERIELNKLVLQIQSTNEGTEDRSKLINQLNTQYPSFLANLDKDKVSNAELAVRLKQVNDQLVNKIILQQKDEEIAEQNQRIAENRLEAFQAEDDLLTGLISVRDRFNLTLKEEGDIVSRTRDALKQLAAQRGNGALSKGSLNAQTRAIRSLNQDLQVYERVTSTLNEKNQVSNRLLEERNQLLNRLGINLSETNPETEVTIDPNAELSPDEIAARRKTAEEREKLEREIANKLRQLQIDLINDATARKVEQLEFDAQREIQALQGSADQKLQQQRLIEEKLAQDIEQVQREAREKIQAEDLATYKRKLEEAAQAERQSYNERLGSLEAYLQLKQIELTEAAIAEVEAGTSIEQAEKQLRQAQLGILREFLEKRKALEKEFGVDSSGTDQEIANLRLQNLKSQAEAESEIELSADRSKWDKRIEIADAAAQVLLSISDALRQNAEQNYQRELVAAEKTRDKQLARVGDNAKARERIETQYQETVEKLERERLKREKRFSLFNAIINTATAVTRALASSGPPLNIIQAAVVGAAGAAQIATISSQKFRDGGKLPAVDGVLRGPSHENGGLKLVDPQGRVRGEVEGQELILSRRFYQNNKDYLDSMLAYSLRTGGARMFREGGVLTTASTTPSPEAISTASQFNDANIVAGLLRVEQAIKGMNLRIGELEADRIVALSDEYQTRKNETRL